MYYGRSPASIKTDGLNMDSDMNKKIGFIGLGQMGRWMALNLCLNDFDLIVFDRSKEAMDFLTDKKVKKATSPAEVASHADWIFLSLPNSGTIEEVVFGPEGVIHGSGSDRILIDLGTSCYIWTREFADRLKKDRIYFSDAPVTGMTDRAKSASLTIMFGGEQKIFEKFKPVFEKLGTEVIHMGGVGNGQLSKMLNNVLYNVNIAALAEVLPMAVKLGLDPEKAARVINTGSGQSFASRVFIPNILDNRFDQAYSLDNAYKDMANVCDISSREKIPIPVVQAAVSTYKMALNFGFGAEDKGAMIKVFEKLLDVEFRKKEG